MSEVERERGSMFNNQLSPTLPIPLPPPPSSHLGVLEEHAHEGLQLWQQRVPLRERDALIKSEDMRGEGGGCESKGEKGTRRSEAGMARKRS